MSTAIALSPVPATVARAERPGPALDSLAGKTVGFRVEYIWPAYHVVAEEWAALAEEQGAKTVQWSSNTHLDEPDTHAEISEFLSSVDVAVVGLGNCGSCTSWAVHDTQAALDAGKVAVCVVTEEFQAFAEQVATRIDRLGMRMQVLPYPLITRDKDELKEIAREHFGRLLRTCGLPV